MTDSRALRAKCYSVVLPQPGLDFITMRDQTCSRIRESRWYRDSCEYAGGEYEDGDGEQWPSCGELLDNLESASDAYDFEGWMKFVREWAAYDYCDLVTDYP
jgi:hypothetical protein